MSISDSRLVESTQVEPVDTKGQMYTQFCKLWSHLAHEIQMTVFVRVQMTSIEHMKLLQHWDYYINNFKSCPAHVKSAGTPAVGTRSHAGGQGSLPADGRAAGPCAEPAADAVGGPPAVATACLTGAEEDDGLEVGVLIAVHVQSRHRVTELLQLPDVLHHLLYPVSRKFI